MGAEPGSAATGFAENGNLAVEHDVAADDGSEAGELREPAQHVVAVPRAERQTTVEDLARDL